MLEAAPRMPAAGGRRTGVSRPGAPETLFPLYERYCEGEARELLLLIPPEGRRELYRRARDRYEGESPADEISLDRVRRFVQSLLPLPPYEVWLRAYLADRAPFLDRLGIPAAPEGDEPVAVAVRGFGAGWYASLCVAGADGRWRGHLRFHRSEQIRTCATAEIFREEKVDEIRSRFREFTDETLAAFLRSALPSP